MKKILIIGGGASGVAAALSMRDLDCHCEITLCEKRNRLGGMADSRLVPGSTTEEYNYGVQGVHESFTYSIALMGLARQQNPNLRPLLQTSLSAQFVAGDGSWTWNTAGGAGRQFSPKDIQAFQEFCDEAAWAQDLYGLVDITEACEDNDINSELVNKAVIPTLALFFGTGQQQARVPASIAAQVFGARNTPVQIFNLDRNNFITTRPNMRALPPLGPAYRALKQILEAKNINVRLNCTTLPRYEDYDKVIMCTQAEDALALLPENHKARKVLRHARYYDDVTVTHTDAAYMQETFQGTDEFNYYMKGQDKMGFALHKYQQLPQPLYQTIFLQTKDVPARFQAAPADIWRQTVLSVDHLENCVAKLKSVQGPHIYFAGSYTLVNSHEVAIMSGIRAAQLACDTDDFPAIFGSANTAFVQYASL